MPKPRKQLICVEETPYYHCIARCVRRAYLCGEDHYSGQNFDHRKDWLVERLKYLASLFSIDVCAYAALSNHYHLVLYVNTEQSKAWDLEQVCTHWRSLFPATAANVIKLYEKAVANKDIGATEVYAAKIENWRDRLADISWFMRCLNEFIARQAHHEDNCTGRFWEGRFKSQALLDEHALLTCMAYVDLNPIRAGLASTPEISDFTSIQERIVNYVKHIPKQNRTKQQSKLIRKNQRIDSTQKTNGLPQAKLKPLNLFALTTGRRPYMSLYFYIHFFAFIPCCSPFAFFAAIFWMLQLVFQVLMPRTLLLVLFALGNNPPKIHPKNTIR